MSNKKRTTLTPLQHWRFHYRELVFSIRAAKNARKGGRFGLTPPRAQSLAARLGNEARKMMELRPDAQNLTAQLWALDNPGHSIRNAMKAEEQVAE